MATALTALLGGSAAASAAAPPPAPSPDLIGNRLVDAPVVRRADPRALSYIVDHLKPGTTIERRIKVSNKSSQRRFFELYAAEAKIKNNRFEFSPGRTPNELSGWVSVNPATLSLKPGDKALARVKVTIPRSASTGERYAVIWAQNKDTTDSTHNVGVVSRVGIRMYLDVGEGGEPPSAFRIQALLAHRTKAGIPIVTARVRNTGGRALDLKGKLDLADGPGGLRAGPFYVEPGTTLLPGKVGTVSTNLDPKLPDGPWKATLKLESGMVREQVSATLKFPPNGSTWTADLGDITKPATWYAGGAALLAAAGAGAFAMKRRKAARSRE